MAGVVTESAETDGTVTDAASKDRSADLPAWPRPAPRVLLGIEVLWRWAGASLDWRPAPRRPGAPVPAGGRLSRA